MKVIRGDNISRRKAAIYPSNPVRTFTYGWIADRPILLRIGLISFPVTAVVTWLVMPRAARLLDRRLYVPRS